MGLALLAVMVTSAWAAGPALTTIQDTIYRADGTPAAGTVLISWPAFTSAEGDPVAAGNQSVAIGTGGAFTTQLVPNVGATPAGTYYTVVFQLDDGTVRTEFWAVPTTSPGDPGAGADDAGGRAGKPGRVPAIRGCCGGQPGAGRVGGAPDGNGDD